MVLFAERFLLSPLEGLFWHVGTTPERCASPGYRLVCDGRTLDMASERLSSRAGRKCSGSSSVGLWEGFCKNPIANRLCYPSATNSCCTLTFLTTICPKENGCKKAFQNWWNYPMPDKLVVNYSLKCHKWEIQYNLWSSIPVYRKWSANGKTLFPGYSSFSLKI